MSVFYTEDAVQFLPDAAPIVGRAEIRSPLEKELEGIPFGSAVDVLEVVVVGDLAYARGNFHAEASPKTGGDPMITSGSFLDIFAEGPKGPSDLRDRHGAIIHLRSSSEICDKNSEDDWACQLIGHM